MYMTIPNFFSVIPVKDKIPLVEWKLYTERHPTAQERKEWDLLYPKRDNGVVTGKLSKILVLDDDGGLDFSRYSIPLTWTAKTPRGGTHYYFKWVPELDDKVTTKVGILPKVDIRGEGGYCVWYGFQKPFWAVPLANPPKWLIDLLPNKTERNEASKAAFDVESWIPEALNSIVPLDGQKGRTPTFLRIINRLKTKGLQANEVKIFLEPWAAKYEYLKLDKLIADQYKRYPAPIQELSGNADAIDSFLANVETVDWIVPNLIARKSIGFVAGLPESRKTWMLMDLAIEVAKGGMWLGRFPVNQSKVLFIDQERFKGETQRRFKAILSAKNVSTTTLKHALFVRSGTTTRINLQHSYEAFRKEIAELRPDLIVIDSFATFSTAEENNRKDIQDVLERIKMLRNEFGCTFLFVHHENKSAFNPEESGDPSIAQMAGSVAIPAAAELVLTVRKHDTESSMVFNTKNTLSSSMEPFLIKVEDGETKEKIYVRAY